MSELFCIPSSSKPVKVNFTDESEYQLRQLSIEIDENKTYLRNLNDVTRDMKIPPKYLISYIAYQLHSKFYYRENSINYIYGSHHHFTISNIVCSFIEEILICPKCNIPEIKIFKTEDDSVKYKCEVCKCCGILNIRNDRFRKIIKCEEKGYNTWVFDTELPDDKDVVWNN